MTEKYEFFTTDNKSGWKTREDRLKKNYDRIHKEISEFIKNNGLDALTFKEKVWHFINDITEIPKCVCGNKVNFSQNIIKGYNKHCSLKCSANDGRIEKTKKTNLIKYGVENPAKLDIVRNKYVKTCKSRYGVDNVSRAPKIKKKREETILNKFGVNTTLKLAETKDKLKEYALKNYGVNHISKSEVIKSKKRNSLLSNHGVNNPMHSDILKNKQQETLLSNHGVKNPMHSEVLRKKCLTNMINTKFHKFMKQYDGESIDKIISWSGDLLTLKCESCETDYTITRELFKLRNSKKRPTCTECNPFYKKDSYGENEVENFIKTLIKDVIINNRTILEGKELDIFIPGYNLAIEFDGLYWHNELNVSKTYHEKKTSKCREQSIRLIHIFEDEWVYKQDIVKSRLKNILGLTENKIYARKCEIKEVNANDAKVFLDANHIQGNVGSKIKIGLYYNDELVSIMTFNTGRIIMSGDKTSYELVRFCNKLDTVVIGGANRLLKHFIKKYTPKNIISYADMRWSQGDLYEKLGFEFSHDSKPNYWYVKNNKRYHRFGFRKSILIKKGYNPVKSEHDIMLERGIYRIYDCGNKCYKLSL